VIGVQMELLSVEVLMEVFQCPHDYKKFLSGDAVISLSLVQRFTVVGLEEHSSNPDVTCIFVNFQFCGGIIAYVMY
jgi:hypothetical protein